MEPAQTVIVAVLSATALAALGALAGTSAPAAVAPPERAAAPAVKGTAAASCGRPYKRSSPWNRPIGQSARVDERSDFHIAGAFGDQRLSSDPTQYTYPVYRVTRRTPRQRVSLGGYFSRVRAGGRRISNQSGGTVRMPIPPNLTPAAGTDAQIVIVDRTTGEEWGAWQVERDGAGWRIENGYRYNTRWSGVPPRRFVSRGAGVTYLAGLVRPCEIRRGRIDHALAFAYDFPTPEHVYPATKSDGSSSDPADLPEGARLQLDPSLTRARLRGMGCRGPCLTIARALQRYGMYVIDKSGRPKIMLEYEATARWRGRLDQNTVRPIALSHFRVLDLP